MAESKSQQVYVTSKEKGKLAITHYKAIKEMKNQNLLEIQLDTGRKNKSEFNYQIFIIQLLAIRNMEQQRIH